LDEPDEEASSSPRRVDEPDEEAASSSRRVDELDDSSSSTSGIEYIYIYTDASGWPLFKATLEGLRCSDGCRC